VLGVGPEALNAVGMDLVPIDKGVFVIDDSVVVAEPAKVVVGTVAITVNGGAFHDILLNEREEMLGTHSRDDLSNDTSTFSLT